MVVMSFKGLGGQLRQPTQRHKCAGLRTEAEHNGKIHIGNSLALHHPVLVELLRNW